jgi:hypothetical protein
MTSLLDDILERIVTDQDAILAVAGNRVYG